MENIKYFLLNLPNPPNRNVYRGFAGGFGTLGSVTSETLLPIYLLYGASALKDSKVDFEVVDAQGLKYTSEDVLNCIDRVNPGVVITWVSLPSLRDDLALVRRIREKVDQVVVLGAVASIMPEKVLESADLAVRAGYPHYTAVKNIVSGVEADDFRFIS